MIGDMAEYCLEQEDAAHLFGRPDIPLPIGPGPCPRCGGEMEKRLGKYGEFYGCMSFPLCRGTRHLSEEEKMLSEYNAKLRKKRTRRYFYYYLVVVLVMCLCFFAAGYSFCWITLEDCPALLKNCQKLNHIRSSHGATN